MSRSLKAIDLSMIPFPEHFARSSIIKFQHTSDLHGNTTEAPPQMDMPNILREAIASRLGGNYLEELVMGECNLSSDCVGQIIDGVVKCGVARLGLASNNLTKEGFTTRYEGTCEAVIVRDLILVAMTSMSTWTCYQKHWATTRPSGL